MLSEMQGQILPRARESADDLNARDTGPGKPHTHTLVPHALTHRALTGRLFDVLRRHVAEARCDTHAHRYGDYRAIAAASACLTLLTQDSI
jgi:hypothetical protein